MWTVIKFHSKILIQGSDLCAKLKSLGWILQPVIILTTTVWEYIYVLEP